MRKLLPVLAACSALAVAAPVFADVDFDLGVSWTPAARMPGPDAVGKEFVNALHAGVAFSFLYASWDAFALPSVTVAGFAPYAVPGFLNLWDVGVTIPIGPLYCFLEAGPNRLYVYDVGLLDQRYGVNLRAGAGVRLGWVGLSLSATSIYGSFEALGTLVRELVSAATRPAAWQQITAAMFPSFMVSLYL